MSKKNLREKASQTTKVEELRAENNNSFDFPCVNDYCSGRNGKRVKAFAWKIEKNDSYELYCPICGQNSEFSREDFRLKKEELFFEEEKEESEMVI